MKTFIKFTFIVGIVLSISLSSTACSFLENRNIPDIFELEKMDLSGKDYAMIFSADMWNEEQMKTDRNVLLLIDSQGNWDAYHTYNLDRANINWTKDGLYFSDHVYEYFVDNAGSISKTNKTSDLKEGTGQYGSSVDDNEAVWSWFDIGFDEMGGYQTRIKYQDKEKSTEKIVEGQYNYMFTIGHQLYGASGPFELTNGINKLDRMGLVKFTDKELIPEVLSSNLLPDVTMGPVDISQQVVLKDNIVYIVGEAEYIDDKLQTNLMMWNKENGALEVRSIGASTNLSFRSFYTHQNALKNDELYWFNDRAELKRTNLKTFKTDLIQSYNVDVTEELYYSARFLKNNDIHMVVNDTTWGNSFDKDGTKMRILKTSLNHSQDYTEFPIKDGKRLSRLFSKESLTPTDNSFAVNPKLAE
ncbi:hypothetical protein NQZ71_00420 [Niallia taxi]|uniref:hypothetical protein n=2 Tax=Niallia taxi TaxID=2499688 RepID=UPI002934E491|nr:hypothetical protein [Niallia taxi]WOD62926.1 hypothetical protein NQZ71_00420 [Niallia taxi]